MQKIIPDEVVGGNATGKALRSRPGTIHRAVGLFSHPIDGRPRDDSIWKERFVRPTLLPFRNGAGSSSLQDTGRSEIRHRRAQLLGRTLKKYATTVPKKPQSWFALYAAFLPL